MNHQYIVKLRNLVMRGILQHFFVPIRTS